MLRYGSINRSSALSIRANEASAVHRQSFALPSLRSFAVLIPADTELALCASSAFFTHVFAGGVPAASEASEETPPGKRWGTNVTYLRP